MITTKAAFEEQAIKAEHPDAVPVDGSRIETRLSDDPLENSTSAFLRNTAHAGMDQRASLDQRPKEAAEGIKQGDREKAE